MLEKWKHAADNKKVFGALLTDLSIAFDCICDDLLIAKLNAYGLYPADTDVFKTSSRRLKKVTTSYGQTRRRHNVWQKTSDS